MCIAPESWTSGLWFADEWYNQKHQNYQHNCSGVWLFCNIQQLNRNLKSVLCIETTLSHLAICIFTNVSGSHIVLSHISDCFQIKRLKTAVWIIFRFLNRNCKIVKIKLYDFANSLVESLTDLLSLRNIQSKVPTRRVGICLSWIQNFGERLRHITIVYDMTLICSPYF